ncbi:TPA: HAD family hydrolase [Streptococcus suis]
MGLKNKIFQKILSPKKMKLGISDLQEYQIVSFDVFDTLLKRDVRQPTDIFDIMSESVTDSELASNFSTLRKLAEKTARERSKKKEISLEDIYNNFPNISDVERQSLIKLEKDTESRFLHANIDMVDIFEECIRQGKTIYIISDMYLPSDFIAKILHREGFSGYTQLFVSTDYDAVKSDGSLFDLVKLSQNIDASKWIHIGDSYQSDKKAAEAIGIGTFQIPTTYSKVYGNSVAGTNYLKANILYSFINNRIPNNSSEYYRFGYNYFGPFLWGYINWLHKEFQTYKAEKIFFFARDGLIMKKAYEMTFFTDTPIAYLEVSRKALRIPILYIDNELGTVVDMLPPSGYFTLEMLLDCVGIKESDIRELLNQYQFEIGMNLNAKDIVNDENFNKFYDKIKPLIVKKSQLSYELLSRYLSDHDVNGKFAIVDIGWSGGMQRYMIETLEKLGIKHEIQGYYTGVVSYVKRNTKVIPDLKMSGYLFDFLNDANAVDIRKGYVGLFETLFLEQDGSVSGYMEDSNGLVKAVRAPYEYKDCDGNPSFELTAVQEIQKAALDFISDVKNVDYMKIENYSKLDLFNGIYSVGKNPSRKDLQLFADFRFFDDGVENKLAYPKSTFHYIFKPKDFKSDFMNSRWKIGFLKKLFKVNLYKK